MSNEDLKQRMLNMCGEGCFKHFAAGMGVSPSGLSQRLNSPSRNRTIEMLVELLEAIPPHQWPARWYQLKAHTLAHQLAQTPQDRMPT